MRAAGLRPVTIGPDLRNPSIRAAIRKEAAQLHQHPENDAIDEWLDAVLADNE